MQVAKVMTSSLSRLFAVLIQVAKLAKKLPVGDVKAIAAQLGGAQGAPPAAVVDTADINEEDLT